MPLCQGCHPDVAGGADGVMQHTVHQDKVACQVCHSVGPYKQCYGCHVGKDEQGLPYRRIHELTGVSVTTIGRVARFLTGGNGGYRTALERIKAQVVASNVFERDSIFYQAMQIGRYETVGLGWNKVDEYVDRIQAVTAEQVQQVARKYLLDDHLTVAELVPLPIKGTRKPTGGQHGHH